MSVRLTAVYTSTGTAVQRLTAVYTGIAVQHLDTCIQHLVSVLTFSKVNSVLPGYGRLVPLATSASTAADGYG